MDSPMTKKINIISKVILSNDYNSKIKQNHFPKKPTSNVIRHYSKFQVSSHPTRILCQNRSHQSVYGSIRPVLTYMRHMIRTTITFGKRLKKMFW